MRAETTRTGSHFENLIGGRWVDGDRRLPVEDPGIGEVIGEIVLAGREAVDAAVRAAHGCHRSRALTRPRPGQRLALMLRIADEVRRITDEGAELLCRESAKPLADARGEFDEAARYFEYYGGMADKIEGRSISLGDDYVDWTAREPHGVSAQIVPWNFPVGIAGRSLLAALATGNAVVIKSPELAPVAETLLARACREARVPDGAVNLMFGYGNDAGAPLVEHPLVDQIVFTGSLPTGQVIGRAATGGSRIERPGHFMQPTVFIDVRPDMSIARDEIFGPAISLMKFRDTGEAIGIANGTDHGLVAGVSTRDIDRAMGTAQQLVAGRVFVNEWFAVGVETPFGGIARSGHGREKGLEALDSYLRTRNIAVRFDRGPRA